MQAVGSTRASSERARNWPPGHLPRPTLARALAALALVLLASMPPATRAEDPPTLVRDGRSDYSIVVAAGTAPAERCGAAELQAGIRLLSGAELPVVDEPVGADAPSAGATGGAAAATALPEHAILVGRGRWVSTLGLTLDPARLGAEGFLLQTVGARLVVAGAGPRGTMYGCTTLLEKLGVRWFTPKVTRAPRTPTIPLPCLSEAQAPAFEYREPFFTEAQDRAWAARLKVNGCSTQLDESVGGKVVYHPFVHTFDALVPPALFEAHPEYFPLIGGRRVNGYVQRCLTNPDVLRIAIEGVRGWIREKPEARIHSVSQNDAGSWCRCPSCEAAASKYGAVSGVYLEFVNRVAEAIEKDHPGHLIDTLAYQFTEPPPRGLRPRDNVHVRLCPIACCEAHPYEKCGAPDNAAFLEHLRGWAALTDTLYIWHYNTNFAHYLMPFPDFDEFPAETRLYQRSGVKGIFFEGDYAQGGGGSDAELRSYVMARLLWDPAADSDALVTEWMRGVYGEAWPPMRRWFDLLHEKARAPGGHFNIYSPPTVPYLAPEVLAAGDALFDEAARLAAAAGGEAGAAAAEYVAKARLGLRYAKLARGQPTAGPELDAFLAEVRRFGIREMSEGRSVEAWEQTYRAAATRRR